MNARSPGVQLSSNSAPAAGAASGKPSKNAGFAQLAELAAAATTDAANAGARTGGPRGKAASFLLVVGVIIAGVVVLFGMRRLGLGTRLVWADVVKIDYPIEKIDQSVVSKEQKEVMNDLNDARNLVQVPLQDVQSNPFDWKFAEAKVVATGPDPAAVAAEKARLALEERRKHIALEVQQLKLNSVMAGRVPLANINGKLVRVGDTINDLFVVKAITGRTVELESDGQKFTLEMNKP